MNIERKSRVILAGSLLAMGFVLSGDTSLAMGPASAGSRLDVTVYSYVCDDDVCPWDVHSHPNNPNNPNRAWFAQGCQGGVRGERLVCREATGPTKDGVELAVRP